MVVISVVVNILIDSIIYGIIFSGFDVLFKCFVFEYFEKSIFGGKYLSIVNFYIIKVIYLEI